MFDCLTLAKPHDPSPSQLRYLAALEATYKEAIRGTESAGRPLEVW